MSSLVHDAASRTMQTLAAMPTKTINKNNELIRAKYGFSPGSVWVWKTPGFGTNPRFLCQKLWVSTHMGSVRFQYGVELALFFLHKNPSSAQFRSARGYPCRLYILVPIILMFTLCFELRGSNQNRMFSTEARGFKPWKILKGLGGAGTHDIPNASRYIP